MKLKSKINRLRGFTLLEALTALFILAIVVALMLPLLVKGQKDRLDAYERLEASLIAQGIVETYKANYYSGGAASFDVPDKFDYDLRVSRLDGLEELDLTLWRKASNGYKTKIKTYIKEKN